MFFLPCLMGKSYLLFICIRWMQRLLCAYFLKLLFPDFWLFLDFWLSFCTYNWFFFSRLFFQSSFESQGSFLGLTCSLPFFQPYIMVFLRSWSRVSDNCFLRKYGFWINFSSFLSTGFSWGFSVSLVGVQSPFSETFLFLERGCLPNLRKVSSA